jgi:hypothetical protein
MQGASQQTVAPKTPHEPLHVKRGSGALGIVALCEWHPSSKGHLRAICLSHGRLAQIANAILTQPCSSLALLIFSSPCHPTDGPAAVL